MADAPRPTARQLRELRRLADATGTTFTPPRTGAQASRTIAALRRRPSSSRVDRRLERRDVADALGRGTLASAPRDEEIYGYGSSARWANSREP
jgi:hypothetical protein